MNRSIIRWVMLGAVLLTFSVASFGQIAVGISVRIGPPPLPVYAQPICPGPGFIWTPGYWAWNDDDGYYWVPGTWVVAPVGMLWTPGYWGWSSGFYVWHPGYWGPHVGFYGGINYGFGYTGVGFMGGEWRGRSFYYNRSVTNVSVTNVTNVYNRTVIVNNRTTTSFNGGRGGVQVRPTHQEEAYGREHHTAALSSQFDHERAAGRNRENFASQNHGRPAVAATSRPGDFGRHSAVAARSAGGEYRAPTMSPKQARVNPPSAGNRGNAGSGSNRSEGGFRPFTPPAKNNSGSANGWDNRSNNNNRLQEGSNNHPNQNRMNENHPQNQNRPEMQHPPQTQNRPQMQNHPQMQNRPTPHPQPAPHPQPVPHPQAVPQSRPVPRPAPPHPNSAPHQAGPPHHGKGF